MHYMPTTIMSMKTPKLSFPFLSALLAALASALPLTVSGQTTYTWTNLLGGSWAASANWNGGTVASGAGNTADFSTLTLGVSPTVTLDGARTIGNLLFGDVGNNYNWTLGTGSGGPLTLAVGSGVPTITVNNQNATNSLVLAGTAGMNKAGAGALVLSGANTYTGNTTVNAGSLVLAYNSGGNGTLSSPTLTVNNGASVTATAGNALGYSGTAWVRTLNLYGSTFTSVANGDQGWGLTVNLMGGTLATNVSGAHYSAGGSWLINTLATNVSSVISGKIVVREGNPNNQLVFNVAAGTASPDLLVSGRLIQNSQGYGIVKMGPGVMNLTGFESLSGQSVVSNGLLVLSTSSGGNGCLSNSPLTVLSGAEVDCNANDALGYSLATTVTNSGVIKKVNSQSETLGRPIILTNGTISSTAYSTFTEAYNFFGSYIRTMAGTTNLITGAGHFGLRTGTCYITNEPNSTLTMAAVVQGYQNAGTTPLNKYGPGTLILAATNIYAGATAVNGGTLEVDGTTGSGAVTVASGGVLDGVGAVLGATTVQSGGVLLAGTNSFPGVLSISNTLTLNGGGTNFMRISKTGGLAASDLLQGMSSVSYGGALVVTNVTSDATPFSAGDTFQLFSSAGFGGGFSTIVLPSLPSGLAWNTSQLAVDGSLSIIAGTTPPGFSPPPGGYVGAVAVTISAAAGTTIIYTTDGSDPTSSGTAVSGASPINGVIVPVGVTETLKAYATNSLTGASAVVGGTYVTVPTAVWTNTASGTWGTPGNWYAGAVGNASGVTADFSTLTLASSVTVSLGTPETIGTMLFEDQGNAFGWVLSGGTLSLAAGLSVPSIVVSNQSVNISATLASTNGLYIYGAGAGAVTLSSINNNFTNVMLSAVSVTNSTAVASGSATFDLGAKVAASTVTVNSNATLTFTINNVFGGSGMSATNLPTLVVDGLVYSTRYNAMPNLVLNGGTLDQAPSDSGTYNGYQFLGSVTVGGAAASTISSENGKPDHLLSGGTTFNVAVTGAGGPDLEVSCALTNASGDYGSGAGWLIKTGAGTMDLSGANTYSGATTVSNGTLQITGSIANGPVNVSGGILEVDGITGTGTITVNSGGKLDGNNGAVNGLVTLNGGTLSAGTGASLGTLFINPAVSLNGGTTALRISKTGGSPANDQLRVSAALSYGGTLSVTNITSDGTPLANGDTFYIFSGSSYSGNFTTLKLPPLPAGLFWDTANLTASGAISVTGNAPTPVFNPTPGGYVGPLTVSISSAPGSEIWYTTDGSDPASSPTTQSNATPATVVLPVNSPGVTIIAFASLPAGASIETFGTFSTTPIPTWTTPGSGNWSTAGNWSNNVVANGINQTADFSTQALGGDATVALDIPAMVGSMLFGDQGNAYNWWLTPGGNSPLTLNVSSGTPSITVENGSAIMAASLAGTNGLAVNGAGNLVLTNFCPYTGNTVVNGHLTLATNSGNEGTIDGTLTVNPGGTVFCTVVNALGYTNTTAPRSLWVQNLNLLGGTLTSTATGDQGFGLIVNLMGGTLATIGSSAHIAAGGGTVINTLATNVTSVISGTFNARDNNPSNQIPFNVASSGGAASPDLLVSATIANATAGVGIVKNGPGVMALGAANTFSGATIVSNGILQLTGGGGSTGTLSNSPVTVETGAELQAFTSDGLGFTYSAVRTLTLNGGVLREINTNSETLSRPITMANGTVTANSGAGLTTGGAVIAQGSQGDCFNLYNATAILSTTPGTTNYLNLPAGCNLALRGGSFSNAAAAYLIVNGVLNGWGGSGAYSLSVSGPGTMVLNSNNTYTGSTIINGGNLEVDGSIAGSAGAVTVNGGILDGIGTINCPTTVALGGTLMAGTVSTRGTLSVSNVLTLNTGGNTVMRISKTGGTAAGDLLRGMISVGYGGTLTISNLTSDGNQFVPGDTLQLFNSLSYGGSFASIQGLPALTNGFWSWDTSQLIVNGTIRVINGTTPPSFSPPGGSYVGAQSVTISSDAGSTIIYTTDGSNPTTSPTAIAGASPLGGIIIPVGTTEIVKAYATNAGTAASLISSATYITVPTAIWTNVAGGSWPDPVNWNVGAVANGSGIMADFSTLTLTSNTVVSLSPPETVGSMIFKDQGNAYGWQLAGMAVLTLDAGSTVPGITVNNQSASMAPVLAGTNGLVKTGPGTLILTAANSYSGTTVVSNGILELSGSGGALGAISNSPVTVESGAELQCFAGDVLGFTYNPIRTLTLNGGTLREVSSNSETLGRPITMINGTITANPGAGNPTAAVLGDCFNLFNATAIIATAPNTTNYIGLPAGCHFALRGGSFSNAANSVLIMNGVLDGWTGSSSYPLIKTGPGLMTLNSNNTYTGFTVVSNGTLDVEGSISNGQTFVYGGVLDGNGSVAGDVSINPGGILGAGNGASIGTLTINNTLELSGTAFLRISKTGGVLTNDLVRATQGVTYGGQLAVTNVTSDAAVLTQGDAFSLFSAPGSTGSFSATNLPALPGGLAWSWNPASGVISVVSGVDLNPATANFKAVPAGSTLQFSWAPDHLGWQLYTNSAGLSVANGWHPIAGSASVTNETIPINPANPKVFFQLRYP